MTRSGTFWGMVVLGALLPGVIRGQDGTSPQPSTLYQYSVLEGTIGKDLEIRMTLFLDSGYEGNRTVEGWYQYRKHEQPIRLWGVMEDGSIKLEEVPAGAREEDITGRFIGDWSKGEEGAPDTFSGTWSNPAGSVSLPFSISETWPEGMEPAEFYHFAVSYKRMRGDREVIREREALFPQFPGESAGIQQLNGWLRSRAAEPKSMEGQASDKSAGPVPSLAEVERSISVQPIENEFEDYYINAESWHDQYDILLNQGGIVSIRLGGYAYTGGAHGNSWDEHITFDLKAGRRLTLGDILAPGWEPPLTQLAEEVLRANYELKPDQPLTDGPLFEDSFALNENWYLVPEGLGFSYVPYEIGPYAAGFIRVVVPWEKLSGLVKPDWPLDAVTGW